jgi:ParB family chromosome partitioning protein
MNMKRSTLGKNLQALLSTGTLSEFENTTGTAVIDAPANQDGVLRQLPVEKIQRSPYQPRREFNQENLQELAQSIKVQGVLQPIIVRVGSAGHYELIAGERRWRAAQLAGLTQIPAIIRQMPDQTAMAVALIENIQRQDLNPLEECYALQRLLDEFGLTHQQVAEAVGRSRAAVSNLLRLQQLSEQVRQMLERQEIEMGHARALLALPETDQFTIAQAIKVGGLSVRQAEKIIRDHQNKKEPTPKSIAPRDPDVLALEQRLAELLGAAVSIKHQADGKGQLLISYHSLEALDGILDHIK